MKRYSLLCISLFLLLSACEMPTDKASNSAKSQPDALSSWNDGNTKKAIIDYVKTICDSSSDAFIPPASRIAVFDNDGTLWSEQPAYFQLYFTLDRIKAMAADHPEWKDEQPFKAVLEDDMQALTASGESGLIKLVLATHSGMTSTQFETAVKQWFATAQHPTKHRPFTDMVYQPMLELLQYLRDHQFKTYIVSGGGVAFMRPVLSAVYGIPPEQIIGSTLKTTFDNSGEKPVINILPQMEFINDKEGKPLNIQKIIGRKPVFCAGNSDGDLPMLQWTASSAFKNFELYVHHTDSVREWAYDRNSHIGKLDVGLDEAQRRGWHFADMQNDWKVIYPFEKE